MSDNPHIGSSFDDFLAEEGLYEQAHATASKRVIAWQIKQRMEERGISKSALAKQMNTSRPSLDRLLDPDNDSVTLHTLIKAAACLDMHLHIALT